MLTYYLLFGALLLSYFIGFLVAAHDGTEKSPKAVSTTSSVISTKISPINIEKCVWQHDWEIIDVKKGESCILVEYLFCPAELGICRLDGPLAMSIEIDKTINSSWEIVSVIGYKKTKVCPVIWNDTKNVDFNKKDCGCSIIYWYDIGLKDNNRLAIRLKQLNNNIPVDKAISKIKSSQNTVTLKIHSRENHDIAN